MYIRRRRSCQLAPCGAEGSRSKVKVLLEAFASGCSQSNRAEPGVHLLFVEIAVRYKHSHRRPRSESQHHSLTCPNRSSRADDLHLLLTGVHRLSSCINVLGNSNTVLIGLHISHLANDSAGIGSAHAMKATTIGGFPTARLYMGTSPLYPSTAGTYSPIRPTQRIRKRAKSKTIRTKSGERD